MGVLLCRVSNYSYLLYLHMSFRAICQQVDEERRMQVKTTPSIAHAERNYESPQYMLPSDDIEHERCTYIQIFSLSHLLLTIRSAYFRLNLQHRVIRRACGGKLYFAPVYLGDGDRVLESGVGTGTFH